MKKKVFLLVIPIIALLLFLGLRLKSDREHIKELEKKVSILKTQLQDRNLAIGCQNDKMEEVYSNAQSDIDDAMNDINNGYTDDAVDELDDISNDIRELNN
nr:hypothetical protein [Prevotella sp.]